jgi:uncharacterized protein
VTLTQLRRATVAHNFPAATTLPGALEALGFVQADPIRAPARAQDLTLRHRVAGYKAGDLERQYAELDVHEDVFVNYGFVTGRVQRLMHPRGGPVPWPSRRASQVRAILEFVRSRPSVHPRDVDAHFSAGRMTNYWGTSSNAATHLLAMLHYRGLVRVVGREAGIRLYAAHEHGPGPDDRETRRRHLDELVDVIVRNYAPLPAASLSTLVRRLRYAVPQWTRELDATLQRARQRLTEMRIDGVDWYWAADESIAASDRSDVVRLLAPFDPLVWDRRRFELLWGWAYRFEAYTPALKRKFGYYALPLLWRDRVIGWANASVSGGSLHIDVGYVASRPPRDRLYRAALEQELQRFRDFLGVS